MGEALKPTSLIDIRSFLAAHGCAPAPWEKSENVVDRLFQALCQRQGDKRFWADLKTLVGRLDDERFNVSAMKGSSVFHDATLDKLVDDLRFSINGGSESNTLSGLRKWVASSATTTALLSFLLLGVSTSCLDADSDDSNDSGAETTDDDVFDYDNNASDDDTYDLCDEAVADDIIGYQGEVYCDLIDVINDADITDEFKQDLLDCLPDLDATSRVFLLNLFENMSDEEIAAFLGDTDEFCSYGYGDDDDDYYDDDDH
jgi:hypothetical protein